MEFINQEQDLIYKKNVQILYFYASWMPFYKRMMRVLNKMEEDYKDFEFFAIDVDKFKNLCQRFSIQSVPSVLFIKNDKEYHRVVGITLMSAFKSACVDIYNSDTNTEK